MVLPRGLAPALTLLLDTRRARRPALMQDILAGGDAGKSDKDRRTLANDITQLRLLSTHVPFDTSNCVLDRGAVRAMQDRVAALTPIVSAVEDRMRALQADGQPPENVARLLASISKWIDAGPRATHATALRLRAAAVRLTPAIDSRSSWRDALLASLMTRLRELIDGYDECLTLRREIRAGLNGAARRAPRHLDAQRHPLHRDHGMAPAGRRRRPGHRRLLRVLDRHRLEQRRHRRAHGRHLQLLRLAGQSRAGHHAVPDLHGVFRSRCRRCTCWASCPRSIPSRCWRWLCCPPPS